LLCKFFCLPVSAGRQFLFPAGLVIACKLHSTQTFERGAAGVAASMLAVKSAGATNDMFIENQK